MEPDRWMELGLMGLALGLGLVKDTLFVGLRSEDKLLDPG